MSIADQMIAGGCMPNLDAVHGEQVRILSGKLSGQALTARHETKADFVLDGLTGPDARAKDVLYFTLPGPGLESQTVVQTEDGRKWKATRREFSAYQEEEYEITEIAAKDS